MNRPFRALSRFVVTLLLLAAASSRSWSEDVLLLRLDRRQPVDVPSDLVSGITVVQELQTAWLVRAERDVVLRLQARGVALAVLDEQPVGKRYFLAYAPAAEAGALASAGSAIVVEPGVYLLDARHESIRDQLPAAVSLKRLPEVAAVPLTLETPGRSRAVQRESEAEATAHPDVARVAGLVSRDRLGAFVGALEGFQTRYASTASLEAAGTTLLDYFRGLGLEAEPQYFTFGQQSYQTSNIVATIPGHTSPERIVILCAHYDSYSTQPAILAPGADDNASGTAAVMEAARVLSTTSFDFTVRLIAFSAEEWGLFGSRYYAANARRAGEQIIAVLNLDMIGYVDQRPEDIDIVVDPRSQWLSARFASVAAEYAPLPIRASVNASMRASDHSPFWDQGYSALLAIEDTPLENPYYHQTTDTLETLDLEFLAATARAAVALTADLAQPISVPPTPSGVAVRQQTSTSLFSEATSVLVSWRPVGGATGYHVYRSPEARGTYTRMTASPVTGTSFIDRLAWPSRRSANALPSPCYIVTAVDSQGRESNRSAEASAQ